MSRDTSLRLAAAALTGVLFALGVPDTGWWPLGFVLWAPLLWAIDGQRVGRAALYGLVAGAVMTWFGFNWMLELLERFAKLPAAPAYGVHLLFACAQGAQWALFGALVALAQRRSGASLLVLAPLAWVVGEAVWPHLFPTYGALVWCARPELLQLAELGGVTVIGAVQLATSAGLYRFVRERSRLGLGVALALGLFVPTFGLWRMATIDARVAAAPTIRVGVVQGNYGIREWSDKATRSDVLMRIQAETAEVEAAGVDLLLWGENVYPYPKGMKHVDGHDASPWAPQRIRVGFSAPLIFGAVTAEHSTDLPVGSANPYGWNSAIVLGEDGQFGDVYDKNYPLWFGEYAPLVDPAWYLANVPGASHINAGTEVAVLRVGEWRFGPLICYEDILPRFARRVANEDVHAFVNLTSDSWFGRSAEQAEHLGLAVVRTIEHRRAMVRAVNSGPSAYVDPNGRVVYRTDVTDPDNEGPAEPVSFVVELPMMDPEARTVYARFGEWFPMLAGVVLAAVMARGRSTRTEDSGSHLPS